jgi:transcriptional repressor NrdR
MHCPVCNSPDTRVIDSRLSLDGTSVRRRRECEKCEFRFSTLEEVELLDVMVVKRDGHREVYSREKMERGLRKALEKRSYTENDFRSLVHSVERDIQRLKANEIRSSDIGEIVMRNLKSFDQVAYIRFASVYRSFEDVKTFQEELKALERGSMKKKRGKKKGKMKKGGKK